MVCACTCVDITIGAWLSLYVHSKKLSDLSQSWSTVMNHIVTLCLHCWWLVIGCGQPASCIRCCRDIQSQLVVISWLLVVIKLPYWPGTLFLSHFCMNHVCHKSILQNGLVSTAVGMSNTSFHCLSYTCFSWWCQQQCPSSLVYFIFVKCPHVCPCYTFLGQASAAL